MLCLFFPEDRCDAVFEKYRAVARELLDIIFGSEEQAKTLLCQDLVDNRLPPGALWTEVLFRLATQRINGFGLSPLDAQNDEDVFQTLWPRDSHSFGQYELIAFDNPPIDECLLLPELYFYCII